MRTVFGRPVLLIPLGLVLVLTGIWVALDGIGAHRTGTAVEDARLCAASDAEPCLEEVDVRVNGPVFTRRAAGDDFTVRTIDGDYLGRVTVDEEGSALLGAPTAARSPPGSTTATTTLSPSRSRTERWSRHCGPGCGP